MFLISGMAACAPEGGSASSGEAAMPTPAETAQETQTQTATSDETIPFAARYVRTGDRDDNLAYPQTAVIRSLSDLYAYYDDQKYILYLNDFADEASVYDAAFFEENALAVIVLQEGSGSIRHEVTGVSAQGDILVVDIDRLLPEVFTSDMALWHIITEVPQQSLAGRQIGVRIQDTAIDYIEMAQYTRPRLTSAGRTAALYEAVLSSVTYDPETGEQTAADFSFSLSEIKSDIPELTVGSTLAPKNYWIQIDHITLWNADFNVLDEPETLTSEMLYALGPGTYYAGYQSIVNTAYVEKADAYNRNTSVFLVALTVPESTAGLAGQWAALGGFAWDEVTGAALRTSADGETIPMTADADGITRLMAQLCTTPQMPAQMVDGEPDMAQMITLEGEIGDLARIIWTGEYLYLDTGGLLFALDAPPWLFGMLTESILERPLISAPEAETLAAHVLSENHEWDSAAPVSARIACDGNCVWEIVFDTENGSIHVYIAGDVVNEIEIVD